MPDTTVLPETGETTKDELEKLYHVIILNDDEHTFDYVIEMLQAIFGFPYATALAHTMEADATGSSIVWTCGLEEAERKRDAVHAYGPDWRMPNSRGSVAALIEPAGT
ncbi:MAG: ATP-dependent Clp protease adaptor ClpS [Acidobacteria bacterium]|nr:ATP-dependent Clp protease adaptor ClpS [Acidobacteriota bacterium]